MLSSERRIEDQPADIYVGFLGNLFSQAGSQGDDAYSFKDVRPFDALRASCLFAQPWPDEICADGLFWVDSQPDLCFRLSISTGSASYRTYGRWLATRVPTEGFCSKTAEAFSGRPWHHAYGDRIQRIEFQGANLHRAWLDEIFTQCLIEPRADSPN